LARGRLLVASPSLIDPNFIRTVVYLLGHDDAGSIGVVVNRPSDTLVDDIVPAWESLVAAPRYVFMGGPVQIDGALCVARVSETAPTASAGAGAGGGAGRESDRSDHPAGSHFGASPSLEAGEQSETSEFELYEPSGFRSISGVLGTVSLDRSPDEVQAEVVEARVFAGYAGWGAGQLEAEVLSGDWFVFEMKERDVFDPEPGDLWGRVLRRQGGWLAVLARHPLDPSVN
jgi:putative transcriptional regulator